MILLTELVPFHDYGYGTLHAVGSQGRGKRYRSTHVGDTHCERTAQTVAIKGIGVKTAEKASYDTI